MEKAIKMKIHSANVTSPGNMYIPEKFVKSPEKSCKFSCKYILEAFDTFPENTIPEGIPYFC
jgi:hypothetical protein